GIRDLYVTGVQTCALPIFANAARRPAARDRSCRLAALLAGGQFHHRVGSRGDRRAAPLTCRKGLMGLVTWTAVLALSRLRDSQEIGRASCRERVEMLVVVG